jgi:hypothetical protein
VIQDTHIHPPTYPPISLFIFIHTHTHTRGRIHNKRTGEGAVVEDTGAVGFDLAGQHLEAVLALHLKMIGWSVVVEIGIAGWLVGGVENRGERARGESACGGGGGFAGHWQPRPYSGFTY